MLKSSPYSMGRAPGLRNRYLDNRGGEAEPGERERENGGRRGAFGLLSYFTSLWGENEGHF